MQGLPSAQHISVSTLFAVAAVTNNRVLGIGPAHIGKMEAPHVLYRIMHKTNTRARQLISGARLVILTLRACRSQKFPEGDLGSHTPAAKVLPKWHGCGQPMVQEPCAAMRATHGPGGRHGWAATFVAAGAMPADCQWRPNPGFPPGAHSTERDILIDTSCCCRSVLVDAIVSWWGAMWNNRMLGRPSIFSN